MFNNYFIMATRTLWKNKVFAAINILGLAIGISASLVIYLLVQYDFSFDKFHPGGDRIYRVVSNFSFAGDSVRNSGVSTPIANTVPLEVTGLETTAAFRIYDAEPTVSVPGKTSDKPAVFRKQDRVIYAGSNYFNLLPYQWVAGSAATSLKEPYQVVLTTKAASVYFPQIPANAIIGRELLFDDTIRTTITGIVQSFIQNTDFNFETFISRATLEKTNLKPDDWEQWNNTTSSSQFLVKLTPGITPAQVEEQVNKTYQRHHKKEPGNKDKTVYTLQPLSDLHFNPNYDNFNQRQAHLPTLYGLLAVAAFLLLLGCINFINLTTAQAAQRAKEIGIRKTMGSSKIQLIGQFLCETFLLTLLATLLSVLLTPLILKIFSGFIPEGLVFSPFKQPGIFLFLLGLTLFVSMVAGFYPALVLSGYKPVLVLKNQAYTGTGQTRKAWLRKTLTVSQFVVAQVFIIATLLVSKQINYSLHKDMGMRKDAILFIRTPYIDPGQSNKKAFAEQLRSIPEISLISLSSATPSSAGTWTSTSKYKDGNKELETSVHIKHGDANFLSLYGIKLLAGTPLPNSDTTTGVLINENYAHLLGFQQPQEAVGKYLDWNERKVAIHGVVADFHLKSLHEPMKPLIISNDGNQQRTVNILLQPQNASATVWKSAIQKMERAWKKIYPEADFEYRFYDEEIAKFYIIEQRTATLLIWATGLAVFISCLGLLGLVIFTTTLRTREIGVRKVLGASITQIVTLLSKDFVRLVIVALFIAAPLAWWGVHQWLQQFAYRTDISWWIFVLTGVMMVLIALLTLGIQTIKAATANPVKSLRTE